MAKEVFARSEHKYLINNEMYLKLIKYLSEYMTIDKYNSSGVPYTISNIYYDTDDNYLIRTSLGKPLYKEKLRLRAYGTPKISDSVFLEIKKKFNGTVYKRRTAIILSEAYDFLQLKNYPKTSDIINKQILAEINYLNTRLNLVPKVYLAYDRIAFFGNKDEDLRISFDKNIRSRRYDLHLETNSHSIPLLDANAVLMEIKCSSAKPLWLTNFLSSHCITRQSFSKYGTEYLKHLKEKQNTKELILK